MNLLNSFLKQLAQLIQIGPNERPWGMPLAAALAIGVPVLTGMYFGSFAAGLTASLGGMTFLYMPEPIVKHRLVFIFTCAFALVACYTIGLACQFAPAWMGIAIGIIAMLATLGSRYFPLGPAGGLFFVMTAAIGMFSPSGAQSVTTHIALVALGAMFACSIGFVYSLATRHWKAGISNPSPAEVTTNLIFFESSIIGLFVGISLELAHFLNLDKPYWVPVACMAVIQGATFRENWTKQIHQVVGTILGLIIIWGILSLSLSLLSLCLMMMAFIFIIEALVARHYAFSAIFATPVTFFLAEMVAFGTIDPNHLVWTRFLDTVVGCLVGIIGAGCIHKQYIRTLLQQLKYRA